MWFATEQQAGVFARDQVRAVLGHSVFGDVTGCSAEDARAFGDCADAMGAVGRGAEEEHDVQPFGGEVDLAIGHAQSDISVGISGFEIGYSGRNEAGERACCAVEQAYAEVVFQFGHARRCHGGGDPLVPRGGGHIAEFVDTAEDFERGHVRHARPSHYSGIFESAASLL